MKSKLVDKKIKINKNIDFSKNQLVTNSEKNIILLTTGVHVDKFFEATIVYNKLENNTIGNCEEDFLKEKYHLLSSDNEVVLKND